MLDGFDNVPQFGHHEHTAREMVEANGLLSTCIDGIVVERPLEVGQAVHRPIHIGACAKHKSGRVSESTHEVIHARLDNL